MLNAHSISAGFQNPSPAQGPFNEKKKNKKEKTNTPESKNIDEDLSF